MSENAYSNINENENIRKFPDCFPKNFIRDILPPDCEFHSYTAYRILKNGILDHKAFISSFEEFKDSPERFNLNSPDTYSTSVFSDYQDAEKILKIMCRHHPRPTIAQGVTEPSCGPCKKSYNSSHINWWIFKDVSPEIFFKVVEEKKHEQ